MSIRLGTAGDLRAKVFSGGVMMPPIWSARSQTMRRFFAALSISPRCMKVMALPVRVRTAPSGWFNRE